MHIMGCSNTLEPPNEECRGPRQNRGEPQRASKARAHHPGSRSSERSLSFHVVSCNRSRRLARPEMRRPYFDPRRRPAIFFAKSSQPRQHRRSIRSRRFETVDGLRREDREMSDSRERRPRGNASLAMYCLTTNFSMRIRVRTSVTAESFRANCRDPCKAAPLVKSKFAALSRAFFCSGSLTPTAAGSLCCRCSIPTCS
jgi:hypothetical protein